MLSKINHHMTCDQKDTCHDVVTSDEICRDCGLIVLDHVSSSALSGIFEKDVVAGSFSPSHKINYGQNSARTLQRALRRNNQLSWEERRIINGKIEIKRLVSLHDLGESLIYQSYPLFACCIALPAFKQHTIKLVALVSLFYTARMNGDPTTLALLLPIFRHFLFIFIKIFYSLKR